MIGRLITSRRAIFAANCLVAVIGLVLIVLVNEPRTGTIVFLTVTTLESGVFSAGVLLRSTWWRVEAARAVFWTVLAYFGVAAHLWTLYVWPTRWWWSDDLRELLYLGLAVAGLNLVLTLRRVLGQ